MGSKYPVLPPSKVIKALEQFGFKYVSQKGSHMKYPNIVNVKPTDDYNVIITLENGIVKKFDVKPYISGTWFGELKDKDIFNTVRPCGNTIEWKNGQDIAPHELHELSIDDFAWKNIETVPPDEIDLETFADIENNPDCKAFVSADDAMKELGL